MADLIVEDGTGIINADSYIDVAYADAYLASLGETAWADYDPVDVKEPALRKAAEYLGQVYRTRWSGARISVDQALDWPRSGASRRDGFGTSYSSDIVPTEVKRAQAKLALRAATAALAPDLGRETKKEKIGPLEVEYADGGPQYTRYREVELLVEPLLADGGSGICVLMRRA